MTSECEFLNKLNVQFKVASSDWIIFIVEKIKSFKKPMIISTGMLMAEIKKT